MTKNLQELITDSYKEHPSFQLVELSNEIDTKAVSEFNYLYGDPKEYRSINELDLIERQLISLSNEIFYKLAQQVDDKIHGKFFVLLGEAVNEFLKEEFKYRKKVIKIEKSASSRFMPEIQRLDTDNHFMGKLSNSTTEHILNVSAEQLKEFRNRVCLNKVTRSDLSVNTGDLVRTIGWILDREFKRTGIFDIVSDFFGLPYDHTELALELSTEKSSWWKNKLAGIEPPLTMYAHLDEAFFAPKSIVYLSDVYDFSGPTSCYPGVYKSIENNPLKDIVGRTVASVAGQEEVKDYYKSDSNQAFSSEKFRRHFLSIPDLIRFNSHIGWDVLPNSALESYLTTSEQVMLGTPGDYIVFDGAQLLHRGGLITKGERVVLQVVFAPKYPIPLSTRMKWRVKKFREGIW